MSKLSELSSTAEMSPPKGNYVAHITECKLESTGDGGTKMSLRLSVLKGDYIGRVFFDSINIVSASAEDQRIGRSKLKSLCLAQGYLTIPESNTNNLLLKPIMVSLMDNEVKSYRLCTPTRASAPKATRVQVLRSALYRGLTLAALRTWAGNLRNQYELFKEL